MSDETAGRLRLFSCILGFLVLSSVWGFAQDTGLVDSSLALDIATAGYDELTAWCLILDLNESGTIEQLRERLRRYYSLDESDSGFSDTRVSSGSARVIIESARRSEYFNVDAGGDDPETMVRLSGGVILTVEEPERGRTHRVRADSVVFNQKKNSIVALGNISYIVDSGGSQEEFSGDSLSFELSDWTGVIFRGSSSRQQEVDGENVDFFFRGESIKRPGPEILILEDGVITSHDVENPDFALKARKIWITGPGEWGLFSATLYLGNVPMLYLPFYWKSGSDMLFNPVIGYRTRVGYFMQTTTYFLGRKEEGDEFSIMGFGDSAASDYELERDGLFLIKKTGAGPGGRSPGNTLKYMMDLYTSLGAMAGLYGDFPKLGERGSLDFYATVAVSRSVDENGSVYFSDGGAPQQYWNSSYLGTTEIPLRWGSSVRLSLEKWSLVFDWYSDPFYLRDFDNRKENFDWINFLLSEEGTDINEPDLVGDMNWEIRGSYSLNLEQTRPWLSSISLDNFRTALSWKNKSNQDIAGSLNLDRSVDPARRFYFPDKLVLPDIKVSMRGGSPLWTVKRAGTPDGEDIDTVVDSSIAGEESADYLDSIDSLYSAGLLKASLGYGISSQLYIEDKSASDAWVAPSDVDFQFQAAKINSTQRGDMNYQLDFWDGLTGVSGVTNLSGYIQTHSGIFGTSPVVSDETRLEDFKYSKLLLDNRLNLYFKPFQGVGDFSTSTLSYTIDANLFARTFSDTATVSDPAYKNSWIDGREDFRKHEVSALGVWTPGPFSFSLQVGSNVPPLTLRHSFKSAAAYSAGGWKLNFSQQTLFDNNKWSYQPVSLAASWQGWEHNGKNEVLVSQSARYDVENGRLENTETIFGFWGFETRLNANYGTTYQWNKALLEWQEDGEAFVPTDLLFSYKREWSPPPSWRNRLRYKTSLSGVWDINLSQPSDNSLVFKWTQELHIFKFIDLKLSFSSVNKSMYLYFPWWRDELGITQNYNFFEDLAKSFNIFSPNQQDRLESRFNMERIDLALVHHLRNWDATLEYSGWPALDTAAAAYKWKSEFSFQVKWNPLPLFRQRTQLKDALWTVDTLGSSPDS